MKTATLIACLCSAAVCASADIVDRIAANVGQRVITDSEVVEAIRVTAFIEGLPPDFSPAVRRETLDRLIDQELMRRAIVFTRFPLASESDIRPLYEQLRKRYPDEAAYRRALAEYKLSDTDIRQHLQWQVMTLRFIEYRFQPGVQVSEAELSREYAQLVAKWREERKSEPPSFEDSRELLEHAVRQRLIDSALDRWLGEVRTQNTILYRKGYDQ